MPVLTKKEIRRVARRTVEKLEEGGYRCCVFGSVACSLWGMDRTPNDLDIVVFGQQHDPEKIKAYLVKSNRFTVEKGEHGDYTRLYFNLSYYQGKRCKVDILVSGPQKLYIPRIPKHHVTVSNDIPVVPLFILVILKVQGWRDNSSSPKPWHRKKIARDNQDIADLLEKLDNNDHLSKFSWLPKWFVKHAVRLVKKYAVEHPHTTSSFERMGFDI